ncbi:zinc ribbon domain-containing protein [Persicobacter psychrovividus]|uniref:Transcriptional regulator n=1 Tax=Persicobacter psychrovividus TaxID=387638 RepID=A0ABN6L407_9BACT|nr:transcriptional regulator [Persicobacter psychrovividus]
MSKEKCQSCGMPLSKDPQGGGTNADGSKSEEFCSHCYVDGQFLFEGTVTEFQKHCREQMVKKGFNRFVAWFFTLGIPKLKRWQSS